MNATALSVLDVDTKCKCEASMNDTRPFRIGLYKPNACVCLYNQLTPKEKPRNWLIA